MKESVVQLRGIRTETDGTATELVATVFAAEQTGEPAVWACTVRCPEIFEEDKKIAGVDGYQALELAEMFLRDMLEHHGVRDIERRADRI